MADELIGKYLGRYHLLERLGEGGMAVVYKQTTTAARWFGLPAGGAIVDTPGFQEFGLAHLSFADIVAGFPEFEPHLGRCRFLDCRHLAEPECAIRGAVDTGPIAPGRYEFYRALIEARPR